jgi:hypothetical protein
MSLTEQERAWFNLLQALDDAIAYRTARLARHCPDCRRGTDESRCDDHACDVGLLASYQRRAEAMSGQPPR